VTEALLHYPVAPFLVAAVLVVVTGRGGDAGPVDNAGRRIGGVLMLAAPVVALAQLLAVDRDAPATFGYFGYELTFLRLDDLSAPFAYIFVLVAFLAGLYGLATMGTRERAAALVSAGCGLGVVLAGDLLTLFVMWETKAVASAVLIAGPGATRTGAALRYLLVHVLGGSLLLGGILWHLSTGDSLDFEAFASSGATTLVLVAFLLSAAMPPLHAWLPDAYPSASVAGSVFLSAFTTKAAVYALLRGFSGFEVLIAIGVMMALYGVVFAVIENDIRRLLSYHIVSQVGFMVAAVGVGTAAAANGATAHAFAHILYKGLLFMGAGAVVLATGRSRLSDLGGLARTMPVVFVCTTIGALSIAGVPLLSGFVSKELAVDAVRAESTWALQALKLASVGTFLSVAVKLVWFTFGGPDRGLRPRPVPATMLVAMGLAAAANVVMGLAPDVLYRLMPDVVDYTPFTAAKLSEIVQLFALTALASVLLLRRLRPTPALTLDTDWSYRGLPLVLGAGLRDVRPGALWGGRIDGAATRLRGRATVMAGRVRPPLARLLGADQGADSTPSSAVLGTVLLGALLVVLARSLVS
jgi:multicomponent Na+:H+ antiporter subunit D